MSSLRVEPIHGDHLDAAAALLAARHERQVHVEPLLDAAYRSLERARPLLAEALNEPDASGAVAMRSGEVVGYLLGAPKAAPVWGPNVWVESAGVALAENEPAETARDLYGFAAQAWVDAGRGVHYVLLPSHDAALVDAFARVGFGQQHAHAIREPATAAAPPRDVIVRRAVRDDIPILAELDLVLPEHQGLSPVFSSGGMPTVEEARADWDESFDDPRFVTHVAEIDEVVVGASVSAPIEVSSSHTGLARPDRAGFLGFAAVLPAARGRGVGRALGETSLDWAARAGYRSSVTDWRMTNLLSSRTWPRLGYRPTFLRMHRVVGY